MKPAPPDANGEQQQKLFEQVWWLGRLSHAELPYQQATGEALHERCRRDVQCLLAARAEPGSAMSETGHA